MAISNFVVLILFIWTSTATNLGRFENERVYLDAITNDNWLLFTRLGIDSINKQKRLEDTLINSRVVVENGSISHDLLLHSLPSPEVNDDNDVALKILKSALYVYNSKCVQWQISGAHCQEYLAQKLLPVESELHSKCARILESRREGHHPFRRLLPRNYKDGIYALNGNNLPQPREISNRALNRYSQFEVDNQKNLAVVLWSQFVEHDLSKPVFTLMGNGHPIECCDRSNYRLAPRHRHPACVPLFRKDANGRETCLSYVRSALAIGSQCSFGSVEQLNQATGKLDLSQLYGFTARDQQRMRTFEKGLLKSSHSELVSESLLPTPPSDCRHEFCAHAYRPNDTACFMAGDSRVNSNEYTVMLYTIFLRNHNRIAGKLSEQHADWNDDQLYTVAKAINTGIYRRITFDEWLPTLLGKAYANQIVGAFETEPIWENEISNEFAVAAIRFYYSMMPTKEGRASSINFTKLAITNNLVQSTSNEGRQTPNVELEKSVLNFLFDNPTQMDAVYERGWIPDNINPTHSDVLAFDIQRGRDHGLQPYVKYLEACVKTTINDWRDLSAFINSKDIENLQSMYKNVSDVDLIVGGISEIPLTGSTVGPTFTCILSEQFKKIRGIPRDSNIAAETPEAKPFESFSAVDILCANTELKSIQENIFALPSTRNSYVMCADRVKYF